jgi:hypothetical protein
MIFKLILRQGSEENKHRRSKILLRLRTWVACFTELNCFVGECDLTTTDSSRATIASRLPYPSTSIEGFSSLTAYRSGCDCGERAPCRACSRHFGFTSAGACAMPFSCHHFADTVQRLEFVWRVPNSTLWILAGSGFPTSSAQGTAETRFIYQWHVLKIA